MAHLGGAGGDGPCPLCADPTEPQLRHPSGAVVVHIGAGDPVDRGWCDHCQLPSVLVVPLVQVCRHGWRIGRMGGLGSVRICADCGDRTPHRP